MTWLIRTVVSGALVVSCGAGVALSVSSGSSSARPTGAVWATDAGGSGDVLGQQARAGLRRQSAATATSATTSAASASLQVATYNVRGPRVDGQRGPDWEPRLPAVARRAFARNPDLLGLQELTRTSRISTPRTFRAAMGRDPRIRGRYVVFPGHERAGNYLAVRRDRLRLVTGADGRPLGGVQRLSTPVDTARCEERTFTWAVLEDRRTGRRLVAGVTHLAAYEVAVCRRARVIGASRIRAFLDRRASAWGLPVVLVGDLNEPSARCRRGVHALQILTRGTGGTGVSGAAATGAPARGAGDSGAGAVVGESGGAGSPRVAVGSVGTLQVAGGEGCAPTTWATNWRERRSGSRAPRGPRIDFVLHSSDLAASATWTDRRLGGPGLALAASDHFPTGATLSWR